MTRKLLYIGIITAASAGGLAFYSALPHGADAQHTNGMSADGNGVEGNGTTRSGAIGTGVGENGAQRGTSASSPGAAARSESRTESKSGVARWFDRLVGSGEGEAHVDGASGRVVGGEDKPSGGLWGRLFGGSSSSDDSRSPASGAAQGSRNQGTVAQSQSGSTGHAGTQDPAKGGKAESNSVGAPGGPGTIGAPGAPGERQPGMSFCAGGVLPTNAGACAKCEATHCPHDAKFRPFCEDFADAKDQARCQAVLDCVRVSNCIATGSVACYCGPDLNVVTCKSNPPSPGGSSGAHGDCVAEILAGFPADSNSKYVIDHFADMTTPSGVALSLGQCDYANCGDISGTNECVPYCPE